MKKFQNIKIPKYKKQMCVKQLLNNINMQLFFPKILGQDESYNSEL